MRQTVIHGCVAALLGAFLCSTGFSAESGVQLVVRADRPGARISPTMYGVFFEDINFGADGGLYARTGQEPLLRVPRGPDGLE